MTILVTGATGYLGRHLVADALSRGEQVLAVVRPGSATPPQLSGAEILATADPSEIATLGRQRGVDGVYHLATHYLRGHVASDIPTLLAANVEFGTALLDGLVGYAAPVVTTSSFFQYRNGNVDPLSLYAATKEAFAVIAGFYRDHRGLDLREVVIFDTYGPRDPRDKLVPMLFAAARSGRSLPLGPAAQPLDLVHVDDVVRGLRAAATPSAEGRMTVRADEPVTVGVIVDIIRALPGSRLQVEFGDGAVATRPIDAGDWPRPPGWHQEVPLAFGLSGAFSVG